MNDDMAVYYGDAPVFTVNLEGLRKNTTPGSGLTWQEEEDTIDIVPLISSLQNRGQKFPVTVEVPSMRVLDGHHRICAAWCMGRKTLKVRFVHLEETPND